MKTLQLILSFATIMLIGTGSSFGGPKTTPEASIDLMTYNIRHSTPRDGDQDWPQRRQEVTALVSFHDVDILCTQEARKHQVDDIVADTGFAYSGVGKIDAKEKGSFTAIFFNKERFKLLDEGHFWLSDTPDRPSMGWDAATERLCCWVKLNDTQAEEGSFYIFNVHMDHKGPEAREKGTRLMRDKAQEIAGKFPVIITGDMNALPDSVPISIYRSFMNDSRELSATKPYGPIGTFNGFEYNSPLDKRIDYIFLDESFKVLKYGVLTDSYDQKFPSDHLPVLVRLQMK